MGGTDLSLIGAPPKVWLCVIQKPQQWGNLGPSWTVARAHAHTRTHTQNSYPWLLPVAKSGSNICPGIPYVDWSSLWFSLLLTIRWSITAASSLFTESFDAAACSNDPTLPISCPSHVPWLYRPNVYTLCSFLPCNLYQSHISKSLLVAKIRVSSSGLESNIYHQSMFFLWVRDKDSFT
jgi:hypothetical protein